MYQPLQFCINFELPKDSPNQFVAACRDIIEAGWTDSLLHFMNSKSGFMTPTYNGQYKKFNDMCLKYRKDILSSLGKFSEEEIHKCLWNNLSLRKATMSDICLPYFVMDKWSKCKQVYCYDPEMELTLADTEEIQFDPAVFDRMPFKTIYIEFSPEGIFTSHYHGVFVHIARIVDGCHIFVIRMKHNLAYHTGDMICHDEFEIGNIIINRNTDCIAEGEIVEDWAEFCMFVINALLYLCAVNNEITENPDTAKTYRPSVNVRNKYSEIRKWDVGVRYGNAVRQKKSKVSMKATNVSRTGYSLKPHMRRAHWHHYRVGKGRKDIILKWVEPIFVGSGTLPAVKHKVEG